MKIELKEISIREVSNGYKNDNEEGVVGFGGRLNIRPKYQREFVYKDKKRDDVIDTVKKQFPLNVMYWVKNEDATYEVLDGQQRTVSICEYVAGSFSFNAMYFNNLTNVEQNQILDYKLMIYFCEGNDKEKLDWFKTINIAGEKLTDQELRNAIYTGTWLTDAKKYFSKTGCAAYGIGNDYMTGSPIRQDRRVHGKKSTSTQFKRIADVFHAFDDLDKNYFSKISQRNERHQLRFFIQQL